MLYEINCTGCQNRIDDLVSGCECRLNMGYLGNAKECPKYVIDQKYLDNCISKFFATPYKYLQDYSH